MINKEHLWFLTLFSLVLVLSIYYVTMPSDMLLSNQVLKKKKKSVDEVNLEVEESRCFSFSSIRFRREP